MEEESSELSFKTPASADSAEHKTDLPQPNLGASLCRHLSRAQASLKPLVQPSESFLAICDGMLCSISAAYDNSLHAMLRCQSLILRTDAMAVFTQL